MRQASVAADADALAEHGSGSFAAVGGRFISRGRLALRSAYWLVSLLAPQPPERPTPVTASVTRELDILGFGAIRLVAASALLVGLITIFQAAYQLAPYGAEVVSTRALACPQRARRRRASRRIRDAGSRATSIGAMIARA